MHPERQRLWKIATQLALLGLHVLMVQRAAGRIAIGHDRYGKALLVRLNPSRSTASSSSQRRSFLAGFLPVPASRPTGPPPAVPPPAPLDRKRALWGKSVSDPVDPRA